LIFTSKEHLWAVSKKVHFAKPNKADATIFLSVNFTSKDHFIGFIKQDAFFKTNKAAFQIS
jgi:hypothetical protein